MHEEELLVTKIAGGECASQFDTPYQLTGIARITGGIDIVQCCTVWYDGTEIRQASREIIAIDGTMVLRGEELKLERKDIAFADLPAVSRKFEVPT